MNEWSAHLISRHVLPQNAALNTIALRLQAFAHRSSSYRVSLVVIDCFPSGRNAWASVNRATSLNVALTWLIVVVRSHRSDATSASPRTRRSTFSTTHRQTIVRLSKALYQPHHVRTLCCFYKHIDAGLPCVSLNLINLETAGTTPQTKWRNKVQDCGMYPANIAALSSCCI